MVLESRAKTREQGRATCEGFPEQSNLSPTKRGARPAKGQPGVKCQGLEHVWRLSTTEESSQVW